MEQPKQRGGRKKKVVNVLVETTEQPTELPQETHESDPQVEVKQAAAQPTERKPRGPKKPTINQHDAVLEHYLAAGWTAMRQTSGGLNDIIAHKDKKLHFVQVVTKPDDARYNGLALNTFIQNAFSNNAIPVHAKCVIDEKENGPVLNKVTFANVNDNTRVIVSKGKAAK